jgi:2-keto-4-pentenoate hydratase
MPADPSALAQELLAFYTSGATLAEPLTTRFPDFDLQTAYAVEAEFKHLRATPVTGLKVGYANKAMWRVLKLETLVWAHMYEDTVLYNAPETSLPYWRSPKIEPEIVFSLKQSAAPGLDATTVLEKVEWIALGFEIIDCPFPDWQFKPADFVAAFGLHLRLVVGEPLTVDPAQIPELIEQLAAFKVRLLKNDELVEEGSGRNSLRSPALCLAELASATGGLQRGQLVSSGTLTAGQPISSGDLWRAEPDGLPVAPLNLRFR